MSSLNKNNASINPQLKHNLQASQSTSGMGCRYSRHVAIEHNPTEVRMSVEKSRIPCGQTAAAFLTKYATDDLSFRAEMTPGSGSPATRFVLQCIACLLQQQSAAHASCRWHATNMMNANDTLSVMNQFNSKFKSIQEGYPVNTLLPCHFARGPDQVLNRKSARRILIVRPSRSLCILKSSS